MCSWDRVSPSCSSSTGPATVSILAMRAVLSLGGAGRRSYGLLLNFVHPPATALAGEAPGLLRARLVNAGRRGVPADGDRGDLQMRLSLPRLDVVDERDARLARAA